MMKIIYRGLLKIAIILSSKRLPHSLKNAPLQCILCIRSAYILQLTNMTPICSNNVICKKLHAGEFYTCDFSTEQYRKNLSGV